MKPFDRLLDLSAKWKARPSLGTTALYHEVEIQNGVEFARDLQANGYTIPAIAHVHECGLMISVIDSSMKRHELFYKTTHALELWNEIKKALQDEFTHRHARI